MTWELLIAGAGLLIGAFNVVAWFIERRDRKADVADERAKREEAMRLQRDEFNLRKAEHDARKHAEITASRAGSETDATHRAYRFVLKNLGPSWAKHVQAWLADEETEEPVTGTELAGPLDAGKETPVVLRLPQDVYARKRPLRLWVRWSDEGGGPHDERTNLELDLYRGV